MPGKLSSVAPTGLCATDEGKASEYEILCQCIAELEAREKEKKKVEVRRMDNIPVQNRLVKLIGSKPIFDCHIGEAAAQVLWDTGSQISTANLDWVKETFPEAELRPVSDFLEEGEKVQFTAANNTVVPMVGCVVLNFAIGKYKFPVPFLVTNSELARPIVGYNVIKRFIDTADPGDVLDLLMNSLRDVDGDKVKTMVNVVAQNVDDDDFLGDLRTVKPCMIPANSSASVRCRVKGDVKGLNLTFLCAEPCVADWDDQLVVTESLGELVRGRTPHVNIELRNTSSKDKYLPKHMLVGEICAVNAVLPLKLFNASPVDENVDVCKVQEKDDVKSSSRWQPKADLSHLCDQERKEIEELLREECDVFAKSDTDIGEIPDFQMDIHLTDEVPVNQAYRHLPRKLYKDVRNYLNDLIVNG